MTNLQTNYQSLSPCHDDTDSTQENDVIFHVAPESGKSRWNHIEDLDSFFRKDYNYYQRHGLACIVTKDLYDVLFLFILVSIATVFWSCTDYGFFPKQRQFQNVTYVEKAKLTDLFYSPSVCVKRIGLFSWLFIGVACLCFLLRLGKLIYNAYSYYDIKLFYKNALKVSPEELENVTWYDVQCRLQEVQREMQMCVHKQELTELDIYQRILRHKNYMVAMINKNILPVKFRVPFIGEMVYFSTGLMYNLDLLFFWSPLSPFKSTWQLKDDYKKFQKRKELAVRFSQYILVLGIFNFLLSPFIFVWQVIYCFFSYAGLLRREPGALGDRVWSLYAKLYLRHFNELDHELKARLNRAHRASSQYMDSFSSSLLAIHARYLSILSSGLCCLFIVWAVVQEEILQVDHVLMIITVLTAAYYGTKVFIPDENLVFVPEALMTKILGDIHYIPDHWRGKAHTKAVRNEFSQLFQTKVTAILIEVFSPIVTPFILAFSLRHRALDIIDFFRNFTIDVVGVGDVCSFALMDVSKHGNHHWCDENYTKADQYQQAENGKTELSLMHFTETNPHWKPPQSSTVFINHLREQALVDAGRLQAINSDNPLLKSLHSLESFGGMRANFANNLVQSFCEKPPLGNSMHLSRMTMGFHQHPILSGGGLSNSEGPPFPTDTGLLTSRHGDTEDLGCVTFPPDMNPVEQRAATVTLSMLYLHELHHRHLHTRQPRGQHLSRIRQESGNEKSTGDEHCPLLDIKSM